MKIGNIELGPLPLFLAPMEDVTYKSFRYMCKKFGADVMYTEFVNSDALVRNVAKTKLKMSLFDFDRPVAIQIYGHDIEAMAAAVVKAVGLPVTAKTRLGWDDQDKPVVEAALRLQDAGISALAIHGRTRSQLYNGLADWSLIGEVKNHPRITIPIIGNGDVRGPLQAEALWRQTGVDGLMIGRPSIGRPWIFREIKHYLATGEMLPPPSVEEVVENVREQLQLSISWKEDERRGILEMRRHLAKYFPHLPHFRELKIGLLQAEEYHTVDQLLDRIAEEYRGMKVDYTDIALS